jgi:AcrR family transcriptional regulator
MDNTEKRMRGRPRAYDPDAALRSAAGAFWKTGYSGTSLDDIEAATGMNRPSLRAAFGGKHDIYMRALEGYWKTKFSIINEVLQGPELLPAALARVYGAALDIYFANGDHVRGCFVVGTALTEALDHPEIQAMVVDGFQKLDASFETRLARALGTGELALGTDVQALAVMATAVMHTIALRARAGASRPELGVWLRWPSM